MSENSIKEELKKLIALQKIDEKIYDIQTQLEEKPKEIDVLKQEFELKKTQLKNLEEKLTSLKLARKDHELELQTQEGKIAKAQVQLSEIKTNKEYTAKISEIESIKADMSIIEEKILISFDQADAVNQEIEKEKGVVAQEEKKYLEEKQKVDELIKQIQAEQANLKKQRQELIPTANSNYLMRYEKVLKNKKGLAIVPVVGHTCGGCFMNVTSQKENAILMADNLVSCEMCSRILYIEDAL